MVQENSLKPKVIVICGPTASGKTKLAVDIAKRLDTEIISADSIAIYKDLQIGTAKPSIGEMQGVKHHLIDFIDSKSQFTVFDYEQAAKGIIDELIKKGKIPIICGGTGYYINSVLYSFSYGNCKSDEKIRKKYQDILTVKGSKYLYEMLKSVDEETYNVLHENDSVRIIRALEIFELSGIKKSEIKDEKVSNYDFKAFSFKYPREKLYERINLRVDKMFEQGLLEEVKTLLCSGLDESFQSMQAIGYKEIVQGIKNNSSVDEMKELIKLNTRHYAKRQITYFNRLENLTYLDPTNYSLDQIIELIKTWIIYR